MSAEIIVVISLLLAVACYVLIQKLRYAKYFKKYGDERAVRAILKHRYYEGQTAAQLIDALGKPKDIDEKSTKSKTRRIYKYNQTGKNRFSLRITLENDVVVGWEKKA